MVTEVAAKKKWCPFARQTDRGFGSFNRVRYPVTDAAGIQQKTKEGWPVMSEAQQAGGCHCIGSKCMAWIEFDKSYRDGDGVHHHCQNSSQSLERVSHGYCGLAGKP